jgi:hypothetical protein
MSVSQITKISPITNYEGAVYYRIIAPAPTTQGGTIPLDASNNVGTIVTDNGTYDIEASQWETGNGGYYRVFAGMIGGTLTSPVSINGTITAQLKVDSDNSVPPYVCKYYYKSYGFSNNIGAGNKAQGLGVVIQPCDNDQSLCSFSFESSREENEGVELHRDSFQTSQATIKNDANSTLIASTNTYSTGSGDTYVAVYEDVLLASGTYNFTGTDTKGKTADLSFTVLACNTSVGGSCGAGTDVPLLNGNSISNDCPDLKATFNVLASTNTPDGAVLEYHTVASPTTNATKVADYTSVDAGTYHAIFYHTVDNCYSPSTPITVSITACSTETNIRDVAATAVNGQHLFIRVIDNDDIGCTGNRTYEIVAGSVVNGTMTIDEDGIVDALHNTTYAGSGFVGQYRVLCDNVSVGVANIVITVPAPSGGNSVTPNTATTTMNTVVSFNVVTDDEVGCNGVVTYEIVGTPVNGTMTISNIGSLTATPATGYIGTAFTGVYRSMCGATELGRATITVTVTGTTTTTTTTVAPVTTTVAPVTTTTTTTFAPCVAFDNKYIKGVVYPSWGSTVDYKLYDSSVIGDNIIPVNSLSVSWSVLSGDASISSQDAVNHKVTLLMPDIKQIIELQAQFIACGVTRQLVKTIHMSLPSCCDCP